MMYGSRAPPLGHKSTGKNSDCNLQSGPRTRSVRCMDTSFLSRLHSQHDKETSYIGWRRGTTSLLLHFLHGYKLPNIKQKEKSNDIILFRSPLCTTYLLPGNSSIFCRGHSSVSSYTRRVCCSVSCTCNIDGVCRRTGTRSNVPKMLERGKILWTDKNERIKIIKLYVILA